MFMSTKTNFLNNIAIIMKRLYSTDIFKMFHNSEGSKVKMWEMIRSYDPIDIAKLLYLLENVSISTKRLPVSLPTELIKYDPKKYNLNEDYILNITAYPIIRLERGIYHNESLELVNSKYNIFWNDNKTCKNNNDVEGNNYDDDDDDDDDFTIDLIFEYIRNNNIITVNDFQNEKFKNYQNILNKRNRKDTTSINDITTSVINGEKNKIQNNNVNTSANNDIATTTTTTTIVGAGADDDNDDDMNVSETDDDDDENITNEINDMATLKFRKDIEYLRSKRNNFKNLNKSTNNTSSSSTPTSDVVEMKHQEKLNAFELRFKVLNHNLGTTHYKFLIHQIENLLFNDNYQPDRNEQRIEYSSIVSRFLHFYTTMTFKHRIDNDARNFRNIILDRPERIFDRQLMDKSVPLIVEKTQQTIYDKRLRKRQHLKRCQMRKRKLNATAVAAEIDENLQNDCDDILDMEYNHLCFDEHRPYIVQPLYQGIHVIVYSSPTETKCYNRYGELQIGLAYTIRSRVPCTYEAVVLPIDQFNNERCWRYWPFRKSYCLYVVDVFRYDQKILINIPFVERLKYINLIVRNDKRFLYKADMTKTWYELEDEYMRRQDIYDPIVGVVLRRYDHVVINAYDPNVHMTSTLNYYKHHHQQPLVQTQQTRKNNIKLFYFNIFYTFDILQEKIIDVRNLTILNNLPLVDHNEQHAKDDDNNNNNNNTDNDDDDDVYNNDEDYYNMNIIKDPKVKAKETIIKATSLEVQRHSKYNIQKAKSLLKRLHLNYEMADYKIIALAYGHCERYIYLCTYNRQLQQFVHAACLQRTPLEYFHLKYKAEQIYVLGHRILPRGIMYLRIYYDLNMNVIGYENKATDDRFKLPYINPLYPNKLYK